MRYVISLSTIPPRFEKIGPALQSLLRQRPAPLAVELYIPQHYRRFPAWGGGLPVVPEGVTIRRVGQDFGPATKVLPAARAWRGQGVELLYVDDDHLMAPQWAGRVLALRRARPEAAICAVGNTLERMGAAANPAPRLPRVVPAPPRGAQLGYHLRRLAEALRPRSAGLALQLRQPYRKLDRSGHADIAEGYGGVAIRPEFLDEAAYDIPPVLWSVDDVWLSGHLERRGIPIWADRSLNLSRLVRSASGQTPLYTAEIDGATRDEANRACIAHMRAVYGIWGGSAAQRT